MTEGGQPGRRRPPPLTTLSSQRDPIPSQYRPLRGECRRQRGSASRSADVTRGSPPLPPCLRRLRHLPPRCGGRERADVLGFFSTLLRLLQQPHVRHSREGGNLFSIFGQDWIPAFAGMTRTGRSRVCATASANSSQRRGRGSRRRSAARGRDPRPRRAAGRGSWPSGGSRPGSRARRVPPRLRRAVPRPATAPTG